MIREFASKAEAAKSLGISASLLSKRVKGEPEGQAVTISKGTKNNSKAVTLIRPDGERLEFESVRAAAAKLGVDKSKMSRAVKGKVSGDSLIISGETFILG